MPICVSCDLFLKVTTYLLLFLQVEINHASEIDAIFDSISYDKGASVIRMLQSYLGAECFQVSCLF
jgi:aminopeptidase N